MKMGIHNLNGDPRLREDDKKLLNIKEKHEKTKNNNSL